MLGVAENELKCVRSGRQLDPRLRLATSEMKVPFVVWYWLIERECFVNVDKKVMVARVRKLISGVCHAHIPKAKPTPECASDPFTICRPDEIEVGVFRRRRPRE